MTLKKTVVHIIELPAESDAGFDSIQEGLITSSTYSEAVDRTIFIGPMPGDNSRIKNRLGNRARLFYSSLDGISNHPYADSLAQVERKFGVSLAYGHRDCYDRHTGQRTQVEVILIDVDKVNIHPVNVLKAWLYEEFNLPSDRYENDRKYDHYVKLAPAALAALRAVGASDPDCPPVLVAYGCLGIPTVLGAILDPLGSFKTVFYAQDIPSVRRIVETNSGHDTMFYNAMKWARKNQYYLGEFFGGQDFFYEHALVNAAHHCDNIVAINGGVEQELRFLGPHYDKAEIDLAPCGLNWYEVTVEAKRASRNQLRQYAQNLLGGEYPDYIFTHVGDICTSRGLWRDLRVLYHLEDHFRRTGKTAVYFLLNTDSPHRSRTEICEMEQSWGWPVAHREEQGDLTGKEASFYAYVQEFNTRCRNIKIVYINQYGWDTDSCGRRMPGDMTFDDIILGGDLAFDQSVYETKGLFALETLAFGSLAVLSSSCGGLGLFESLDLDMPENIIVADYTQIPAGQFRRNAISEIDQHQRDILEEQISIRIARIIMQRLAGNPGQMEKYLRQGRQFARELTWDTVCQTYFLPALEYAYRKHRPRQIA
ncbi:MAG: hypothetical protein JW860_11515 [Sedimentisphaerales bacterium]|nr:hypothetical protein [Sedimentisphaerales bacterium]